MEYYRLLHILNAKKTINPPITINKEANINMTASPNNRINKPININMIPNLSICNQSKLLLFNTNLII